MAKKYPQIRTDLPIKRVWFIFALVIWTAGFLATFRSKVKIIKRNKLPKPPYIVIGNHSAMMDFYIALRLCFPHRIYWISTVEEFVPRFFIFRRIGVLAKRKFTNDPKSASLYLRVLEKKKILVFYPEARYTFVGEPERIDKSMGRFVKKANVPVVYIKTHGNYLECPQWSDKKRRKIHPMIADVETIINKYDIETMDAQQIQQKIEDHYLDVSEEKWADQKHILNRYENRAVGLERILYKCPHCGAEMEMSSETHYLKCNHCGIIYDYLENGHLECTNGETKFNYISNWYKWEKECCKKEVLDGTYHFEDEVRVEKLMGAKIGFVPLEGHYKLTHDSINGVICKGTDNDFEFIRPPLQSYAIHIDYEYLDHGAFLELATPDDTYFVFPLNKSGLLTKIHFAVEHIYDFRKAELKKE